MAHLGSQPVRPRKRPTPSYPRAIGAGLLLFAATACGGEVSGTPKDDPLPTVEGVGGSFGGGIGQEYTGGAAGQAGTGGSAGQAGAGGASGAAGEAGAGGAAGEAGTAGVGGEAGFGNPGGDIGEEWNLAGAAGHAGAAGSDTEP